MASDQAQGGGSYMDNVRVKISEKYKPPPRIGLAMSYAQRLSLNKQIEYGIPQYEFILEKTVIEKMKEWKNARSEMFHELHKRVENARSETSKRLQEDEEIETKATTDPYINSGSSQCYQNNTILMPTQANFGTYSNILTPIPLNEQAFNDSYNLKSSDESPINISDFEADTSSPFDNMELKSINDMEELAQVLKSENKSKSTTSVGVYPMMGANTYTYTIPNSTNYVQPPSSLYPSTNGYYYPPETIQTTRPFVSSYSYSKQIDNKNYKTSILNSGNTKTIPDIMKTLQNELDNKHLDNTPKNQALFPKVKTKNEEELDDFNALPKNVQDMSKSISSMGFPLSRVVRVCQIVGNDQKKVVEHLLAMSELLDLGFSESSVSEALLKCDNDRDKALDFLIL